MIDIIGFEGLYSITLDGKVFGHKRGKFLKIRINLHGYAFVGLCKNNSIKNFTVHRLVAQAFIPNIENKEQVNHINGIKTDNRVENLEWCTRSENFIHLNRILGNPNHHFLNKNPSSLKNGTVGSKIGKFTKEGILLQVYDKIIFASKDTKISRTAIGNACTGFSKTAGGFIWKYL